MAISREEAIQKADHVISEIKENYDAQLANSVTDFLQRVKKGDDVGSITLIHNIASEAATFGWPSVSATAEKVRDILGADNFAKKQQLALLGAHALILLIKSGLKEHSKETDLLLSEFDRAFEATMNEKAA